MRVRKKEPFFCSSGNRRGKGALGDEGVKTRARFRAASREISRNRYSFEGIRREELFSGVAAARRSSACRCFLRNRAFHAPAYGFQGVDRIAK